MEQLPLTPPDERPDPLLTEDDTVFFRVAVERGLDTGALTYRQPAPTTGTVPDNPIRVGDRVEVPLGRGNTKTGGLVIATGGPDLLDGYDPKKVKPITRRVASVLPPSLVPLAQWIARYYLTPLGMVIAAMIPAAVKQSIGARTVERIERVPPDGTPTDHTAGFKLTPSATRAWAAIEQLPADSFPIEPKALARAAGAANLAPINRLVEAGLLRRIKIDLVKEFGSQHHTLLDEPVTAPPLTTEQSTVVEGIDTARRATPFGVHLLRGVTGSGKTEVYIHLIQRALAQHTTTSNQDEPGLRGAIVLVPEIALTPQTAGRFVARLTKGDNPVGVEVLHSGLSASARNRAWSRLASGESRVAVGARSAVFAPIDRPALIIVDEEHDSSYKQDQLPRYNARDVAIKRAHADGAHVVLGSATPSLESWWNAHIKTPEGSTRSTLWELPTRVAGTMPEVRIVAPRETDHASTNPTPQPKTKHTPDGWIGIGPILAHAMRRTFAEGGQAMLLLNRRGFASYVACTNAKCGWSLGCESCDARMVVHRAGLKPGQNAPRGFVRCHHCLAEQKIPKHCPACEGKVILFGLGIQRVQTELASVFKLEEGRDFARLDSDSVRKAADYFSVLDRFANGELKLLLGTQMIAKGLDFPNVRLVGVINADTSLAQPDFRAAERTFQLVSQVAGRAGRGEHPGTVIVQTMHPQEPSIALAAKHDYHTFAKHELRLRHSNGQPPCTRMARIVCRDPDARAAEQSAAEIARLLRDAANEANNAASSAIRIEGPMPCVLSRVADHFRFGVELTAPDAPTLMTILTNLRSAGLLKSDHKTAIDVDPVSLM